jgi:hypothetical protein
VIRKIIKELQDKGLPLIILRDSVTGKPSITYSFFVISGVLVILGLVGKFAKVSGGIDMENALSFFYGCGAMYVGRKMTSKNNDSTKE